MTRLTEEQIRPVAAALAEQEADLISKTGLDYAGLAAAANGISRDTVTKSAFEYEIAAITVTSGLGVITGFAESVAAILQRMGFSVFVPEAVDINGIYEARTRGAELLFLADDNRYMALNVKNGRFSDNHAATARGYVEALERAAGPLSGKRVLVLGCGTVGREAGKCLIGKGARPVYHDRDKTRLMDAPLPIGVERVADPAVIGEYSLIFDATTTGGWLKADKLTPEAWIAAPGLPLSLDQEGERLFGPRLIHDALPIGTLTMLGELLG